MQVTENTGSGDVPGCRKWPFVHGILEEGKAVSFLRVSVYTEELPLNKSSLWSHSSGGAQAGSESQTECKLPAACTEKGPRLMPRQAEEPQHTPGGRGSRSTRGAPKLVLGHCEKGEGVFTKPFATGTRLFPARRRPRPPAQTRLRGSGRAPGTRSRPLP